MKTMKTTLMSLALFITTMTATAQPMSYYAMRENARFLTDRMAYTLGIATSLLDDLYMINYDYICGVNDYLDDVAYGYHYDDYMTVLYARDAALRRLLTPYQWTRLVALDYFYRPITFVDRRWSFGIYAHDPYRTRFYYSVPVHYHDYRGGHFFHGMAPAGGPHGRPNRPQNGAHPGGGPGYHIGNAPGGHNNGNMNNGRGDNGRDNRNVNIGGNGSTQDHNVRSINNNRGSGTAGSGTVGTQRPSSTRPAGGTSVQGTRGGSSTPSTRTTNTRSAGSSNAGAAPASGAGRSTSGGSGRNGGRR